MFRKKAEIQDIQYAEIKKVYKVKDKNVCIRMQNASSALVNQEKVILDEVLIMNMMERIVETVKQNHSKYNPIPDEIILRNASYKIESENLNESKKEDSSSSNIVESYDPRFGLEEVAMNTNMRQQIQTAISAAKYQRKMEEDWGMSKHFSNRAVVLNFYGKPGTGKSMAAEAVAKALRKKVYRISYSELESKYVGDTPKNIHKAFESATKEDAVLIFEEADSFLGKRLTSVTQSADYGVNITRSVLLMELEKFTGTVIFTTNLMDNYDEAFKRRIFLNVYFEMPNEDTRATIWTLHLSDRMPLADGVCVSILAKRYEEISGADIKDMIFYAALHTLEQKKEAVELEAFDVAYTVVRGRYENKDSGSNVRVISSEKITEEEYQKAMAVQEKI